MKNALDFDKVVEIVKGMRAGTFQHIEYYTLPTTTNKSVIYKVTEGVMRTKIDRTHTKGFTPPTYHRIEDSTYIIDKAIKHNNNKNTNLLCIFPNYKQSKVRYFDSNGNEMNKEYAKSLIVPKKSNGTIPEMITVNAEQILGLGKVR